MLSGITRGLTEYMTAMNYWNILLIVNFIAVNIVEGFLEG